CSSGLPPQLSRSSFPIHEPRHPLFPDAPRARRFVSTFRLSLHQLEEPVAARGLISCAPAFQTSPAVARLLDSPTRALRRQRPLRCAAFPLRWPLLSRYGTARS